MDFNRNINFELEKTVHLIRSKTLEVFRENNFPISKEQWLILERIAAKEGSNQKDIAKDTFKDPAALTRMLDLLVDKGFAQRKTSKSDRRTFDIYLTVEGGRLVNRITPTINVFHSAIEQSLTKEDEKYLLRLLSKLQDKIDTLN
ncbi:MAG: DNA-binding MarR family transcriptional regulator [Vicingaceae bacterium]|jgi:DNA-binding MarR family transcriptional regulator